MASPYTAHPGWHGQSGERYAIAVHDVDLASLADLPHGVLIAIARQKVGGPNPIGNGIALPVGLILRSQADDAWCGRMRAAGAVELHVHWAETDQAARDALTDLDPNALAKASGKGKTRRAA